MNNWLTSSLRSLTSNSTSSFTLKSSGYSTSSSKLGDSCDENQSVKPSQTCFIYDLEYCQSEYDDPNDAIVYYNCHKELEPIACDLCLHLVGLWQFITDVLNSPQVITLTKDKYALVQVEHYVVILGGNIKLTNRELENQLQFVISLFQMHHKSFDQFYKYTSSNHTLFIRHLGSIIPHLLTVSQYSGNALASSFQMLPAVNNLPVQAWNLAGQIQEMIIRHGEALSSCVLFRNKVVLSQLPRQVTENVTRVYAALPFCYGEKFQVSYVLPPCVFLTKLYVSETAARKLRNRNGGKQHIRPSKLKFSFKTQAEVHATQVSVDEVLSDSDSCRCSSRSSFDFLQPGPSGLNRKRSKTSDFASDDCTSDSETGSGLENSRHNCGSALKSRILTTGDNSLQSDGLLSTECVINTKVNPVIGDVVTSLSKLEVGCESAVGKSLEEIPVDGDSENGESFCLYVQYSKEITLLVVIEEEDAYFAERIDTLWRIGLQSLSLLEEDVKFGVEHRDSKGVLQKDNTFTPHLHYDKTNKILKGVLPGVGQNGAAVKSVFSSNELRHLHNSLNLNDQLTDLIVSRTSVVDEVLAAHQTDKEELYYSSSFFGRRRSKRSSADSDKLLKTSVSELSKEQRSSSRSLYK